MLLKSFVEICRTHACVDDRKNDEEQCDNSETRQIFSDWQVVRGESRLVHPCKLENEVCHSAEVQDDCDNHPEQVLPASCECGAEENENCDWYCGNCESKLGS